MKIETSPFRLVKKDLSDLVLKEYHTFTIISPCPGENWPQLTKHFDAFKDWFWTRHQDLIPSLNSILTQQEKEFSSEIKNIRINSDVEYKLEEDNILERAKTLQPIIRVNIVLEYITRANKKRKSYIEIWKQYDWEKIKDYYDKCKSREKLLTDMNISRNCYEWACENKILIKQSHQYVHNMINIDWKEVEKYYNSSYLITKTDIYNKFNLTDYQLTKAVNEGLLNVKFFNTFWERLPWEKIQELLDNNIKQIDIIEQFPGLSYHSFIWAKKKGYIKISK